MSIMPYDTAIDQAWQKLEEKVGEKDQEVAFLSDTYSVDLKKRSILSLSCNVPAKDYLTILLLHYIIRKLSGLPKITGEWIPFTQLAGGQGYYPTFKKRVIDRILRKYAKNPDGLLELVERFSAKKTQIADISVVLEGFIGIPVLITMSRSDEEFDACANIHFDKSITDILCTEDIVVMAEFIASKI